MEYLYTTSPHSVIGITDYIITLLGIKPVMIWSSISCQTIYIMHVRQTLSVFLYYYWKSITLKKEEFPDKGVAKH